MWVQADAVLAMLVPNGCSMPGTSRRYACAWLRVCRPAGKYAADGGRPEAATSENATDLLASLFRADFS
jgi:hypothetical protein